MGDPLTLASKEYACLRMLQVLAMVRTPISDGVKAAVMGLEDAEHKALGLDLQDVADLLKIEIGRDKVTARTRRHL